MYLLPVSLTILVVLVATSVSLTVVPAGKLPTALTQTAAVQEYLTEPTLLVLGGLGIHVRSNAVLRYHINTEQFEEIGNFPHDTIYGGSALIETNGRIYYVGGVHIDLGFGTYSSLIYQLTPWNPTPVQVALLPEGISGHCSIYDGTGTIYTMGGANGSEYESRIFSYSTTFNSTGEFVPAEPVNRIGAPCVTQYGTDSYIFGGMVVDNSGPNYLNTVLKSNPAMETIETINVTLPVPLSGAAAVRVGRYAYIIGGETGDLSRPHYVTRFDMDTQQAIELFPEGMKPSLMEASAVYYHPLGRIYVFGGFSAVGGGFQDEVFYIQLE